MALARLQRAASQTPAPTLRLRELTLQSVCAAATRSVPSSRAVAILLSVRCQHTKVPPGKQQQEERHGQAHAYRQRVHHPLIVAPGCQADERLAQAHEDGKQRRNDQRAEHCGFSALAAGISVATSSSRAELSSLRMVSTSIANAAPIMSSKAI